MWLKLTFFVLVIGGLIVAIDLIMWRYRLTCWLHRWDVTRVWRWHHELTCKRCGKVEDHGHG